MKGKFLIGSVGDHRPEGNIFADKSSLVLDWLLKKGWAKKEGFSLREIASEIHVSIGLVQRIMAVLVQKGLVDTIGVRTAKKFFFHQPKSLLNAWLENYSLIKKCRTRTYASAFQDKADLLATLRRSSLRTQAVLALHSAAEAHGFKNTNLQTLEIYMFEPKVRVKLEDLLQLEPKDRGYEVLLIEPFYKSLLNHSPVKMGLNISSVLLTFLDLFHFPLRGVEQAEFMAERAPELKPIFTNERYR